MSPTRIPSAPNLVTMLEAMTTEQRAGATQVLDAVSRPLLPREIETLLRARGVSSSRAKIIASTVKHFHLIALIGPEGAPDEPRGPTRTVIEVKRRVIAKGITE